MQNFIEFIIKYKNYISFVALVVISLALVSMGNVNKIGGMRTVIVGSMGFLQNAFSWIPNPKAIKNENQALRELNLQLSTEVTRMRDATVENKSLRALLGFKPPAEFPITTVEVVGLTEVQMRSYIMIDKGYKDDLCEGMPVRNDAGLIGAIISSGRTYSLVESILNRDVRISAKCLRSGYPGIVVWEGGEYLIMKNVPKSYDIKTGDLIVTSNFSNKYPENIPIGQVVVSTEEKGELFLKIRIKPAVNYATLEQAFVLKFIPNPERNELIKELDERLKLRHLEAKKGDKIIFEKDKKKKDQKKEPEKSKK